MADEKNVKPLTVVPLEDQTDRDSEYVFQYETQKPPMPNIQRRYANAVPGTRRASDARSAAFRSTLYLRELAHGMGINPVEILLFAAGGIMPKFSPVKDPETGRVVLQPVLDQGGNPVFEQLIATEQLIGAKEASKYLFPQLKAVDLAAELKQGTGADEDVSRALQTFANLARLAHGGNTGAIHKMADVPGAGEAQEEEDGE